MRARPVANQELEQRVAAGAEATPVRPPTLVVESTPAAPSSAVIEPAVQHRQSQNIWNHFLRALNRITVLVVSDLLLCLALGTGLRAVRAGWLGTDLAQLAGWLFPAGLLGGVRLAGALILSLAIAGTYRAGDARRDGSRLLSGTALAVLISLYPALWSSAVGLTLVRGVAVIAVFALGLTASRSLVNAVVWRLRPRLGVARALVVAHGDTHWREMASLRRIRDFVVVGHVTLDGHANGGVNPRLRTLGKAIDACRAETVLLWGDLSEEEFAYAVDVALATGCQLLAAARTAFGGVEPRGVWIGGRQLIELTPPSLRGWQLALKRAMDLGGAVAGLALLGPVMLVLAAIVRLDSAGPALFVQRRVGAKGRLFHCFKFRSMKQDAEQILRANPELYRKYLASHFKLPERDDPRLTRVGRFLRKTSLDELPQLFNVLLGQMSLVGPRPIVPAELEHYGYEAALVFMSLKPGMTGAWAVNGRSKVGYPGRAQMELDYIRRWSLLGDLAILLRTVPAVLGGRGAH
jgi:lipopolysaccharide/colanic/teichoic acid biosynthesis glycosyltransferase